MKKIFGLLSLAIFVLSFLFPPKIMAEFHMPMYIPPKYNFDVKYDGNRINDVFYLVMISGTNKNITSDEIVTYCNNFIEDEKTNEWYRTHSGFGLKKCLGKDCVNTKLLPDISDGDRIWEKFRLALYLPSLNKVFITDDINLKESDRVLSEVYYKIFNYQINIYSTGKVEVVSVSKKTHYTEKGEQLLYFPYYLIFFVELCTLGYFLIKKKRFSWLRLNLNIIYIVLINIVSLYFLINKFEFENFNLLKINIAVLLTDSVLICLIVAKKSREKVVN